MMPWLELRSGAPGLDGPFLLEHRIGYQIFDDKTERPDIFLAIGGKTKRRLLRGLRLAPSTKHNGVVLEELFSSTILLDCELHNATLPRVKAGPRPESCVQHLLKRTKISDNSPSQDVAKLSFELIWQSLVPFTSTVVIFLDDVGGLIQLSEILANWAAQPIQHEPRIVILHDIHLRIHPARFETVVWRKTCDREVHIAPLGLRKRHKLPFEGIHFLPINERSSLDILAHVEQSAELRRKQGLAFNSVHFKDLIQQSIRQFAAGIPAPFNFYTTARRRNPISKDLEQSIVHFVHMSRDIDFDLSSVIASALVLDALPPGMHAFPPGPMFDHLYSTIIERLDKLTGTTLLAETREWFILFVEERRGQCISSQHLSFLSQQQSLWTRCSSTEVCLVCLARRPRRRLSCAHRLCDACVIICELVSVADANWPRSRCPLCQKRNHVDFVLRPATAGIRALEIKGTVQTKAHVLGFLRQLQKHVGLPLYALREQFDFIMGCDIGAYFVQTVFLEGWSADESGHHLNKITKPSLLKHSKVSFGEGLEWNLDSTRLVNKLDVVLKVKDKVFSNIPVTVRPEQRVSTDITVRCDGNPWDQHLINDTTSRMIASLFYVEPLTMPSFFTIPEPLYLRLCCRVPNGLPLVTLLYKLRLSQTTLSYWAGSSIRTKEQLVTRGALERCKTGRLFSRLVKVEVSSYKSKIQVRICANGDQPQSISKCPYAVRDLLRDAKVDCVFGTEDHRKVENILPAEELALEEMDRLQETMEELVTGLGNNKF